MADAGNLDDVAGVWIDGKYVEYSAPETLVAMLQSELVHWGWLKKNWKQEDVALEKAVILTLHRNIMNLISDVKAIGNSLWAKDQYAARLEIQELFKARERGLVLAEGLRGGFVLKLKKQSAVLAIGALAEFFSIPNMKIENKAERQGRALASEFLKSGSLDDISDERLPLTVLADAVSADLAKSSQSKLKTETMEERLAQLNSEIDRIGVKISAAIQNTEAEILGHKQNWAQSLQALSDEQMNFVQQCGDRLKALEETYTSSKALEAPANYWNEKAIEYQRGSKYRRITLMWFAGAAPLIAFAIIIVLFSQFFSKDDVHSYWVMLISGLIATGVIWTGRILVKLYLSELHLMTDAMERVTMASTFLALSKGGHTKDSDTSIILNALLENHPMVWRLMMANQSVLWKS